MSKEATQDAQTDIVLDDQVDTPQVADDKTVNDQPTDQVAETTEDEVVVSIGEEPPPQEEQAQALEVIQTFGNVSPPAQ